MKAIFGLTTEQAIKNKAKCSNKITKCEKEEMWSIFNESLEKKSLKFLIVVLTIKVCLSTIVYDWSNMKYNFWADIVITCSIIIYWFIQNYITYNQNRKMKVLVNRLKHAKSKVYRDGELIEIPNDDIVREDCVFLQAGDKIPADGILLDGYIKVNQFPLNGVNCEIDKIVSENERNPKSDDLFSKIKCFRESIVTYGSAIMLVTAVGKNTFYGKNIYKTGTGDKANKTPFDKKIESIGKKIKTLGYFFSNIVAIIYVFLDINNISHYTIGNIILLILNTIILKISIILITDLEKILLARNYVQKLYIKKMLANKIYVKKLHSIDTASNLTHVFIGKTGTLTKSELNVSFVITGEANIYENFCGLCNELRKEIIIGAGVNNDAIIIDNKKVIGSNNIDRALLSYLAIENNVKINPNIVECSKPFNSAKKYSSIITRNSTKYMKGDPEVLLKSCDSYIDDSGNEKNFTSEVLSKLKKIYNKQIEQEMTIIAIIKECNNKRIFIAFAIIKNNIAEETKYYIKRLAKFGVNTTLVTGDSLSTARIIAKKTGIITQSTDICVTHNELAMMKDAELLKILPNLKVVAKALPSDKVRLIELSQSIENVVGVTGNKISDITALQIADVGFAINPKLEAVKEVSDVIIFDNCLSSIYNIIVNGCKVSKSIKKIIGLQLIVNIITIIIILLGLIFCKTQVSSIIQILGLNIIINAFAIFILVKKKPQR